MKDFKKAKRIIQVSGKYVTGDRPQCLLLIMDSLKYGEFVDGVAEEKNGKVAVPFWSGSAQEWDGKQVRIDDGINHVAVVYKEKSIAHAFCRIAQNDGGRRFAVIFPDKMIHASQSHRSILDKDYD